MIAGPFLIFGAAASALFVRLVTWGITPIGAFVIVSVGASAVTLGTLLVVEALDSRHTRARKRMHVVRPEVLQLEEPRPTATVVDVETSRRREILPLPPGGGAA